ncbi:trypsin-like serine peptidase [Streptomyces sp. TRM68416]|uniref:trypsin-like serine peptidase n=1 Tax=Streptomyces sp. TRM68416 TaxID=2758412 RepID=UPI001661CF7C|nr:peptidase [Streptomyces sp. TRM68416]MBD0839263.1 peptidase [Streptomyces sp. TRM68416]
MRGTSRIPRSLLGALVGVTALLTTGTLAAPAGAAPAPAPDPGARSVTAAAQERARDFWTPQRMRDAAPLDLLDGQGARGSTPAKGAKATVAPTAPAAATDVGIQAFPNGGSQWTGGGAVVSTAGRVFFTYQGRTASCSGNAVTSANKSTVITAGHCVKMDGAWHTNWVFVPGYHDGQAPHGRWTASKTLATPQWTASEDINYDVGAAVVAPLGGRLLTDVVGGQGLAFNTGYNLRMYSFGFPAAAPYDGEKFIYCSGNTNRDFLLSDDHGMTCNMTGGSSGGPWFTQFNESTGTGLLSSVNSFKYNFFPNRMYGPYFGADAQNLYQAAQSS